VSAGGDYGADCCGGCAAFRPSRARTSTRYPSDIDSSCSIGISSSVGISSSGWARGPPFSRDAVAAAQMQAPFLRERSC